MCVSLENYAAVKVAEKVCQFGVLGGEVNFLVNIFESSHFELLG